MIYKTNTQAQLWTKSGAKAGLTQTGVEVETNRKSLVIKERLCWEIISSNYAGKYIEPKYLAPTTSPDPEPPPSEPPAPPVAVEYISLATFYTDGTPPSTEIFVPLISGE